MRGYAYDSIIVNGRQIELEAILNRRVSPVSAFETSTFTFIERWFSTADDFTQRTSGSTGAPKPIVITRHQMVESAKLTIQALQLNSGDTALVCLDTEYIAGKMMLVRAFVANLKIVATAPALNPLREIPGDTTIDFAAIVPAQLHELVAQEWERLNAIKNILVGGAAIPATTKQSLAGLTNRIYATYGMTETISHIALQQLTGRDASDHFTVLPGIKINTDNRGCLEIAAPYLLEKITTNDIVSLFGADHFNWLGRSDNIINTGGVKVIPEKIESQIAMVFEQFRINNKFLVSSVPDAVLGNKVIVLIEGTITDFSAADVKNELRQHLSPYEMPKNFYLNINFVLTKNGKINRFETSRQVGNDW